AAQPPRPEDGRVRIERGHAGLGHARGIRERHLHLAQRPRRRHRRLALAKMPSWLGGGAHWAGFSWTNAPLPAYTLLTLLVVWQGFPFVAVSVLAGLKTI